MSLLDDMTAGRLEAESIRCPHCQKVQDLDDHPGYDELVTLWGSDNGPGVTVVECDSCSSSFQVRESGRGVLTMPDKNSNTTFVLRDALAYDRAGGNKRSEFDS